MADRPIQTADAIVAAIQGKKDWGAEYVITREWNPTMELENDELKQFVLWVVPKDDNSELAGCGPGQGCIQRYDLVVYLIVQFRPDDPNAAARVDAAAEFIAAVHEWLKQQFLTLADGTTAKWQKSMSSGHDFKEANRGLYRKEFETHWRIFA